MAIASDIFGLNRQSITESFDGYETINLEQELKDIEPLEEGVDPLDYMLGVAYECEIDMQRIEMDIIGEEYSYLRENGTEMVYESDSANTIIDKFKAWIDKLWTKIQAFFKSVLAKFSDKWLSDEKFAKKYENKKHKEKVKTTTLDPNTVLNAKNAAKDCINNTESVINFIDNSKINDEDEYKDILSQAKKNMFNTEFFSKLINEEDINTSAMFRAAKIASMSTPKMSKKAQSAIQEVSFNKCIKILKASKSRHKDLSDTYNANKKMIAAAKKSAKKMESAVKRFKVLPTEESKQIHYRVKLINKTSSWISILNKFAVQCLNMISNNCRRIVLECLE